MNHQNIVEYMIQPSFKGLKVDARLKYRSAWWLPASRLLGSRSPDAVHPPSPIWPISIDSDTNMHVGQLDHQGPLDATGIRGQESYMDAFLVL